MSNYTKTVNFATKDNLNSGNPLKIVKGTEIDTEYNNIATAVATKTDNSAAAITGGAIDGATVGSTTPAAGAFTTLAASGTTTLAGALVGAVTQAAFNTVSTTLNLGGAATAVNIGAATGTATVANTTLAAKAITASTTLNVTGASTLTGAVTATAGVTGPITSSSATITGGSITGITDLAVADGGTGASTAAGALNNLLPAQASAANKYLQSDGTNASWDAVSLSTADITGTLAVANGGTGITSFGTGIATFLGTPSSANLAAALTDETGTGSAVFATSPTLVTPNLGTPSAAVLTLATGLPLSTGVTGQLPVANGGTGTATPSIVAGTNVTVTGTWPNQTIAASGSSGTVTSVAATVPSVFSVSGSPITTSGTLAMTYSGTALPVANGGTGQTSYTDGQLLIGNTTGNTLTKTTLTAGSGITITNGSGAITIASSGGSGDVVGPASSTDNAFARFDSTTGKLIQNSTGATLSDTGAAVFTGALDVLGNSTAGSNIKLYEDTDNGTNYVSFKAPDTIAANVTWTLPSADGTNTQVLQTNGSGVLSFVAAGGASAATPTALGTVYGITPASANAVAYGYQAAFTTNNAADTTAVGYNALYYNTATTNAAFGTQALVQNTSGSGNISAGYRSAFSNTTGSNNSVYGYEAFRSNTTGGTNVAVGHSALYSNTSASNNTAVGYRSGYLTTTGNLNVSVGTDSLYANTTGTHNTAVGYQALLNNAVGSSGTAVGYRAGYNTAPASGDSYGTYIGWSAGLSITTGLANTCLGYGSGGVLTTGLRGVYVGFNNNASASGANDEILISTFSGATGKGTNTGFISPNSGAVYQGNNSSSWSTTSDQRLKKNIVDNTVGLSAINSIRVRNFEYRLPEEVDAELKPSDAIQKTGVQLGVIAQELKAVLPECVKTESTGVLSVDTDNLTWYLINAVKELKAEFDAYKASHP